MIARVASGDGGYFVVFVILGLAKLLKFAKGTS